MAGTAAWIAGNGNSGAGLTWFSAGFTATNFNSLAAGNQVASSVYANGTALDLYADLSFSFVVGGTTTIASYVSAFLLPLNQDGTTYGDGASATGATNPSAQYLVGSVGVRSGIASGSAVTGTIRGIILPPGSFVWTLANNLGVALGSAAAAAVLMRTYNENLNR